MMRSLWISKTGLDAQQMSLDTISNNLANVSTTAYKRVRPVFEDLMYQSLRAPGLDDETGQLVSTGLQTGTGSKVASTQRINNNGALLQSQNPLDMAINGNGFFVVETGSGPAYTRAGNFMRNNQGQVVTPGGDPLLTQGGSPVVIPSNASSIVIGSDGRVSYYVENTLQVNTAGQIALVNFANPAGLFAEGAGLYRETQSSGSPQTGTAGADGLGSISQFYTEQSNVNVAEELVGLIAAQRAYEITTKGISASDQMLQRLGQM
jgi:flagellar basal-body rod protein FlgG